MSTRQHQKVSRRQRDGVAAAHPQPAATGKHKVEWNNTALGMTVLEVIGTGEATAHVEARLQTGKLD
jgi:Cu/Zn superoxide dismutase